jgi:sulfur-oxidizing protein SoxA
MKRLLFAALAVVQAGVATAEDRRSGFDFMGPETQAMQTDDMSNPGMLAVLAGQRLWDEPTGVAARSCAACHGTPEDTMRGVAARYPAYDDLTGNAVDLAGRVNLCRTRQQGAEAFAPEHPDLLALVSLIGLQSRGLPIRPDPDPRLDAWRGRGADLFQTRMGQLNLSCAQCHDDNSGGHLGSAPIPQAHPVGYPIYRLEWQAMGSLQRRMRGCLTGVRSEPWPYGSDAYIALEAYLKQRAAGMTEETPAVRP